MAGAATIAAFGVGSRVGATALAVAVGAPQQAALSQAVGSNSGPGYWLGAADGGVFSYGGAGFAGSAGGLRLVAPVVGMAASPTGRGYWEVAADGGIFAYGDAGFWGSGAGMRLASPVVGMAATPTGLGYWELAGDGGVFAFGDATFFGSAAGAKLHGPVVAIARTPSGLGYWITTSGGQIFPFGDAGWYSDATNLHLVGPVVGIASSYSGRGYSLVAADGGVFGFGDAVFAGSAGGLALARPIVAMMPTPTGGGYWLVAADGGVFSYGDAPFLGSTGGIRLVAPVVGLVPTPSRHAIRVAAFYYPWYATPARDVVTRHWDQGGHTPPDDIGSDYYPGRGAYSSTDPAVLDGQMAEIADAGINEVVSSWWGQGSFEDHALAGVVTAAAHHGVRVGIHLEPYTWRTSDTVASDVNYLAGLGITDIWVYEAMMLPASGLRAVNDAHPGDLHLAETGNIAAVRSGGFAAWAAAAHFKAIYTYDAVRYEGGDFPALCASSRALGVGCVPAVSPGFTAVRAGGGPFKSRENGATFDRRWMGAIGANPDIIAITSYNEWHEGTQIEPAVPKCLSPVFCYLTYDSGPYRYLGSTRVWTGRLRGITS